MAAPFLLAEAEAKEEVFGLRAFGAIQRLVFTVGTIGGLIGPLFAGFMYDETESYRVGLDPLERVSRPDPVCISVNACPANGMQLNS
ncbi:MAG: hypothetical protein V3T08_02955 [Gemmatimonadota bacterium]